MDIQGQGGDFSSQLQKFTKEKDEEMLANQMTDKAYAFDYFFEKSLKERDPEFNRLDIPGSDSDEEEEADGADIEPSEKVKDESGTTEAECQ